MIVSSRTPEGRPNRCPLCEAEIVLEPSLPFGDAPCPACGKLVWFLHTGATTRIIKPKPGEDVKSWIVRRIAEQLGVPEAEVSQGFDGGTSFLEELRADSLDLVQLVIEFDECELS